MPAASPRSPVACVHPAESAPVGPTATMLMVRGGNIAARGWEGERHGSPREYFGALWKLLFPPSG